MKKNLINFICFTLIVTIILSGLTIFLGSLKDYNDLRFSMFYEEEENSLDLITIGSSTSKGGFIPAQAYDDYGIKSYNFCLDSMPFELISYMLREINETQKNATFMIDVTPIYRLLSENANIFAEPFLNEMKNKKLKSEIMERFYGGEDFLSKNIPLYTTHKNWQKIGNGIAWHNALKNDNTKSAILKGWVIALRQTIKNEIVLDIPENNYALTEEQISYIDELCDTINELNLNVIFFSFPKILTDESMIQEYVITELAKEYLNLKGMNVLDIKDYVEPSSQPKEENDTSTGILNPSRNKLSLENFFDFCHLNVDGSKMYTEMLCNQLISQNLITVTPSSTENESEWAENARKGLEYIEKVDLAFKSGQFMITGNEIGLRSNHLD